MNHIIHSIMLLYTSTHVSALSNSLMIVERASCNLIPHPKNNIWRHTPNHYRSHNFFRCPANKFQQRLHSSNNENDTGSTNDPGAITVGGELVTALARLDKEWKLSRKSTSSRKKTGDWTILNVMDKKNKSDEDKNGFSNSSPPEIVYLLEPSSGNIPSCIIFFLGGAVLGQFPHIAYSAFCERLVTRMNASIVAVPYEVGLDHFSIAQKAVTRMKNALIECEDSRGYPDQLPKYAIGHSLGGKLHSIAIAATGIGDELSGLGLLAYNNFGFAETITMARSFTKELQQQQQQQWNGRGSSTPFDALFDLAGMAVSAVGLEFTPSPMDMDTILRTKFDDNVLKKIRLFRFEDDDLDSTTRFMNCFDKDDTAPLVSHLPGTHLTPVYLKLGLDDLPDEARDIASQVAGEFQNASFGNEAALETLVTEISEWMLGSSPTTSSTSRKQISGIIDAEVVEK